jgi:hypothetical protein
MLRPYNDDHAAADDTDDTDNNALSDVEPP